MGAYSGTSLGLHTHWKMSQYSGKIVFYEGKCFTGRKLEICGDCDNFQDRGFMNRVNSIRVESGAFVCYDHPDFKGQQYMLELFEEANFGGQCVELTEDCPFLQGRGLTKNQVNSVRVYGDGAWAMYEEPNFRGRMYMVERGNYSTHMEWQSENPNIQSIR